MDRHAGRSRYLASNGRERSLVLDYYFSSCLYNSEMKFKWNIWSFGPIKNCKSPLNSWKIFIPKFPLFAGGAAAAFHCCSQWQTHRTAKCTWKLERISRVQSGSENNLVNRRADARRGAEQVDFRGGYTRNIKYLLLWDGHWVVGVYSGCRASGNWATRRTVLHTKCERGALLRQKYWKMETKTAFVF